MYNIQALFSKRVYHIEGEAFSAQSGHTNHGTYMGDASIGSWLRYDVNFVIPKNNITVYFSKGTETGQFEVRLGSTVGTLIGTVDLPPIGWGTWGIVSATLSAPISGSQQVFLVWSGNTGWIDWIKFT